MVVRVPAEIRTENFLMQVRSVTARAVLRDGSFFMYSYIGSDGLSSDSCCYASTIAY
jgi:hypothetical protein